MLVSRVNKLQDIKADMMVGIGRIKINYILHSMRWNSGENCFNIFPVRINHADPVAVLNILDNHIEHQYGLTSTGLSEQINMLAPILALDAIKNVLVPVSGDSKIGNFFIEGYCRRFHCRIVSKKRLK